MGVSDEHSLVGPVHSSSGGGDRAFSFCDYLLVIPPRNGPSAAEQDTEKRSSRSCSPSPGRYGLPSHRIGEASCVCARL